MTANNCNNKTATMDAVIEWKDGKRTTWDLSYLPYIRKGSVDGTGYLYFNPHSTAYERYRSIEYIDKEEMQRIITRSASIVDAIRNRQRNNKDNNNNDSKRTERKLPANLRLHQHFVPTIP